MRDRPHKISLHFYWSEVPVKHMHVWVPSHTRGIIHLSLKKAKNKQNQNPHNSSTFPRAEHQMFYMISTLEPFGGKMSLSSNELCYSKMSSVYSSCATIQTYKTWRKKVMVSYTLRNYDFYTGMKKRKERNCKHSAYAKSMQRQKGMVAFAQTTVLPLCRTQFTAPHWVLDEEHWNVSRFQISILFTLQYKSTSLILLLHLPPSPSLWEYTRRSRREISWLIIMLHLTWLRRYLQ